MVYSDAVVTHFRQPHNAGCLSQSSGVLCGEARSAAYRDHVKLYLQIDAASVICTARWQVLGTPATIACASQLSEWLQGLKITAIDTITVERLIAVLELSATQRYSAILLLDALQNACTHYDH